MNVPSKIIMVKNLIDQLISQPKIEEEISQENLDILKKYVNDEVPLAMAIKAVSEIRKNSKVKS